MTGTDRVQIIQLPTDMNRERRSAFCCGSPPLDKYFKEIVTQDTKNNLAKCFVAMIEDRIAGFYTLSASSIALENLTEDKEKRFRYKFIPVVRLGRLAVDQDFKRKGLGSTLVFDAAQRVVKSPIGAYAVMVEQKDDATGFYAKLGFVPIPNEPNTVLLRLASLG